MVFEARQTPLLYTPVSRKVVGLKCTRQSRREIWEIKNTFSCHCSCYTYFCCFSFALANIPFMVSRAILSNFFEKQWTQNHPQYLSGLSRALFPTTFLEIAVYMYTWFNDGWFGHWPMALWEAIVWWSLKQIIGVSSLWPNAQLLMTNNILKATFIKKGSIAFIWFWFYWPIKTMNLICSVNT